MEKKFQVITRITKLFKSKIILNTVFGVLAFGVIFFGCTENKQEYSEDKKPDTIAKMYKQYKQDLFPDVPDILVKDLNKFSQNDLLFVDIRDKREQDVSMIPGAITQQEFEANIDKYKNKIIIAYCTIGNRSGRYLNKFKQSDMESYNLIGGILSWSWSQRDLVDSDGLTKKVHVYGLKWDLLPNSHTSIF